MEIFHWFLASNLVWLIMIATMIKIKASWSAIIVVAIIINALGFASTPISYYVAICINLLFFALFLYGGIFKKNKST